MNRITEQGFTLIELAVVAAVLVILAVVAMSSFTSTNQIEGPRISIMLQVAGAINARAKAYLANQIARGELPGPAYTYPVLDGGIPGPASDTNPLFGNYVDPPITDSLWRLVVAGCYQFDSDNSGSFTTNDACLAWNASEGRASLWEGGVGCASLSCNPSPF